MESENLRGGWVGYVFHSVGSSRSTGVATLISKHLQFKLIKQIKDNLGRAIIWQAEKKKGQELILAICT